MTTTNFKLLFFGSDTFSVTILRYLLERKLCPIQVVTGHNSLLDQYSACKNLDRYRWPLEKSNYKQELFDIGLVASFGHLIDEQTVNRFNHGLFNIHPSLLPRYRGSTPVQTAILDGVEETGCTLMRIPPIAKFDIGDIVLQQTTKVKHREYACELRDRLAISGAFMTERLLLNYDECMQNVRPQNDQIKSYAKKLKPENGLIKFMTEESDYVDRKVRAYTGFIDLYTHCLGGLKVKLDTMRSPDEVEGYQIDKLASSLTKFKNVIKNTDSLPKGSMFFHKTRHILCIKCADSKWLAFDHITPEAKPKMSALDFNNGYLSKVDLISMRTDH